MRQFRMPIQHTKNLSKFKKQIGTILRELKEFDEKEKHEAFSYIQGCISASKSIQKKHTRRLRVPSENRGHTFIKKQSYKCRECEYTDSTKKGIFAHLEKHVGFPLSCRQCRTVFNNHFSFEWHLKFRCRSKLARKALFACSECPRKFFSKQNLNRHQEGHKRNNCTYCDMVITNRKHLIQHLLDVHSVKLERAIYKCSDCDKRYVKRRSLYYHKQQHFTNKHVCLDCGKVCDGLDDFNEHLRKHEQQKNFKCSRCNEKFTRRQQYVIHMKRHDNYKCLTCRETFASKLKMMLHKHRGHTVEGLRPKFTCPECEKEFYQKSKLLFHLRKHTEDKPTLNCQYCEKLFQSPYAYYKHCTTVSHEKSSPETSVYICESCGTQFRKKYLLEEHNLRIHNNRKEFEECQFCPYKTKNRANMKRHHDTHITNGKVFICEQCGKEFTNLASLKGHISYIHTQNKHFRCDHCDKTFKRNSELVRHLGTHSNDRPHVCKLCGQSYKRSTHLRRHEKSTHKITTQSRTNQKLKIEPDGTIVPVQPVEKERREDTNSTTNLEPTVIPLITFVESEPLALVKRDSERVLISEPNSEINYFDNITTINVNSECQNFDEEDIILDMSSNAETHYFLNSHYTNDQLIQEYIGQDHFQFIDTHVANYSNVATSSRVFTNILGIIEQQHDH